MTGVSSMTVEVVAVPVEARPVTEAPSPSILELVITSCLARLFLLPNVENRLKGSRRRRILVLCVGDEEDGRDCDEPMIDR